MTIVRRIIALALLATAVCVLVGCGRCHQGYTAVHYYAAYTSLEEHCYGKGGTNCVWGSVYHPPTCRSTFECVVKCKDLDAGRSEAHPEHDTIVTPTVIDRRCELVEGDSWQPK